MFQNDLTAGALQGGVDHQQNECVQRPVTTGQQSKLEIPSSVLEAAECRDIVSDTKYLSVGRSVVYFLI